MKATGVLVIVACFAIVYVMISICDKLWKAFLRRHDKSNDRKQMENTPTTCENLMDRYK